MINSSLDVFKHPNTHINHSLFSDCLDGCQNCTTETDCGGCMAGYRAVRDENNDIIECVGECSINHYYVKSATCLIKCQQIY